MTLNLSRTESAWLAKQAKEALEDAEKMLGDKMIMEFGHCSDLPALCEKLAALPEFSTWTAGYIQQIYEEAKARRAKGMATLSPYCGMPIFGSHR